MFLLKLVVEVLRSFGLLTIFSEEFDQAAEVRFPLRRKANLAEEFLSTLAQSESIDLTLGMILIHN